MTKDIVSCTALNHLSLATFERCSKVLIAGTEHRYGIRVEDYRVRERRSGETGLYIDECQENQRYAQ